ncbi:hypothetical protein [Streptomyces caelestis]|uniref:hypothetical protein n=1 Tax=Streptomyces caelestis TaxID=36816 RepID=UPI003661819C
MTRSTVVLPVTMPDMPSPPAVPASSARVVRAISSLRLPPHLHADQFVGGAPQPLQVHRAAVGLTDAADTGLGGDLHDGAQRVELVHSDRVQQGVVPEGHGGHGDAGDPL